MSHPDLSLTPTSANPHEIDNVPKGIFDSGSSKGAESEDILPVVRDVLQELKDHVDTFAEAVAVAGGPREFTRLVRNVASIVPHASRAILPILPAVAAAAAAASPASFALGVGVVLTGGAIYWASRRGQSHTPITPRPETIPEHIQRAYVEAQAKKAFNDRADLDKHMLDFVMPSYQPGDWQQEFLDDSGFGGGHAVSYQLPGDLRDLGSASGRVTAQTWLLGDTLEHDLAPALSGSRRLHHAGGYRIRRDGYGV